MLAAIITLTATTATAHVPGTWVTPQGLPAGHNGGFKELLVEPAAGPTKPHIVMVSATPVVNSPHSANWVATEPLQSLHLFCRHATSLVYAVWPARLPKRCL